MTMEVSGGVGAGDGVGACVASGDGDADGDGVGDGDGAGEGGGDSDGDGDYDGDGNCQGECRGYEQSLMTMEVRRDANKHLADLVSEITFKCNTCQNTDVHRIRRRDTRTKQQSTAYEC